MTEHAARPSGPPNGWGSDKLTDFIQRATEAGWIAAAHPDMRDQVNRLRSIDAVFVEAIGALDFNQSFYAATMLPPAHAAFRAGTQFALEGRTNECMVLLRSCLEYGMYAVHFHRKPELITVWAHRTDGEKERKAVKKHFKPPEMLDGIDALSNRVGPIMRSLYEQTIDFGAHPNETGFFGRLSVEDIEGTTNKKVRVKYLSGGDLSHKNSLVLACRAGVAVLDCFILIFRTRFDILQLTTKIDALKPGL